MSRIKWKLYAKMGHEFFHCLFIKCDVIYQQTLYKLKINLRSHFRPPLRTIFPLVFTIKPQSRALTSRAINCRQSIVHENNSKWISHVWKTTSHIFSWTYSNKIRYAANDCRKNFALIFRRRPFNHSNLNESNAGT